ncbi:putative reverse transcriptase zinc-binding domain-containing protein [Helianthus annuus]|nr:putative reverse transcriptase zinc-binding domain-containing protein [Helianthus annuus]
MKWVAWNNLLTPKDLGGWGFGSLRLANLAMLSKWWWRFKEDRGSLWRKVVWDVHNNQRSWSFIPTKLSIGGPWKQVHNLAKDFETMGINLESLLRGQPGTEKEMRFWKEKWLGDEPLCERYPGLFQLESNKNAFIKDRVIVGENRAELNFEWSRLPSNAGELEELSSISNAVHGFEFGVGADKWVWALEESGEFSVKSIRVKAHQMVFTNIGVEFEWNNWTPIKVNFLLWRLIQDKLPTKMALVRRNVAVQNVMCKMCGNEEETALHLFASCRYALRIWDFVSGWCRLQPIYFLELKDLAQLHKRNRGSKRWQKLV